MNLNKRTLRKVDLAGLAFAMSLSVAATGIVSDRASAAPSKKTPVASTSKVRTSTRPKPKATTGQKTVHKPLASRSGSVFTKPEWISFVTTWYDGAGDAMNGDHVTSVGTTTTPGWTVAVDPKVIPLGSILEIKFRDGHVHTYQALDVGGAIKGHRIDIYEPDKNKCLSNGVQPIEVRIVRMGDIQRTH